MEESTNETPTAQSAAVVQNGNEQQPKSPFNKLPSQIIQRIIRLLPLSDKKSVRLVNHDWVSLTNEFVTVHFPSLCDDTRQAICSHVGVGNGNGGMPSFQLTNLHVSKLRDTMESWSGTKFHSGPRIVSITFENPELSSDNMIWLLTQCYSVRELQFVISTTHEGSQGEEDLQSKTTRLGELFQDVETMKAINISSRTLRTVVIKCSRAEKYKTAKVEGERKTDTQEIDNFSLSASSTTTTPPNTPSTPPAGVDSSTSASNAEKSQPPSLCSLSSNPPALCFDCSIFKNCRLFQSLIITGLPALKLKNLDELPLQLGHILLELRLPLSLSNSNNNNYDCGNIVRSIGFVDFSGPVQLSTFQYIFRLPKIKKYCSDSALIDGQDILKLLPKIRGISKIEWSSSIQHYIIL